MSLVSRLARTSTPVTAVHTRLALSAPVSNELQLGRHRAWYFSVMRFLGLALVAACSAFAGNSSPMAAAANINSRYTVEAVDIQGHPKQTLSKGLRRQIDGLVGARFNQSLVDEIARRIRLELRVPSVSQRLLRGTKADHVSVVLEIAPRRAAVDVEVPKFLYHSRQGWTAAAEVSGIVAASKFTVGVLSDGDELAERYSGLSARYENRKLGSDRVRLGMVAEAYTQNWNSTSLAAAENGAGLYRARQNFSPTVTFVLAAPLTWTIGASFQRLEPELPAARTESANAVITTLRYQRRLEDKGENRHDFGAGYSLRAATRIFSTGTVYARHRAEATYAISWGRHTVRDTVAGGWITGRAPYFERFVAGNSTTLRGWNKFEISPLGADRLAHNSIEYRYRYVQVFYDAGAVWDSGRPERMRHSVGFGLRKDNLILALAFPVRERRVEPMVMLGMNY